MESSRNALVFHFSVALLGFLREFSLSPVFYKLVRFFFYKPESEKQR